MLRNMTTLYIKSDDNVLMLYRIGSRVVPDSWCGIGGHFENDELNDPKRCVLRELFEEVGIKEFQLQNIELKYVTLRLKNSEMRQNYYFFADIVDSEVDISKCDEGKLQWIHKDELTRLEMPFTAKACLKHYVSVGQFTNEKYAGIATSEGVNFIELKEF